MLHSINFNLHLLVGTEYGFTISDICNTGLTVVYNLTRLPSLIDYIIKRFKRNLCFEDPNDGDDKYY